MILGHEGTAEVVETGPGVTAFKPGDRVVLAFLPSCGKCPACLNGRSVFCQVSARLRDGTMPDGTRRLRDAGGATIASTDDVGGTADTGTSTGDETPPGEFGFAPNAAQPSGGTGVSDPDDVADLERLVGRLALENYRLRRRMDAAQNDMNEAS